jgi:hypothetical protein
LSPIRATWTVYLALLDLITRGMKTWGSSLFHFLRPLITLHLLHFTSFSVDLQIQSPTSTAVLHHYPQNSYPIISNTHKQWCSQRNTQATGGETFESWFDSPQVQQNLSRPALGFIDPPIQWVLVLSPVAKRPARADDLSPSSNGIRNEWCFIFTPHYVFLWCIVKNFIRYPEIEIFIDIFLNTRTIIKLSLTIGCTSGIPRHPTQWSTKTLYSWRPFCTDGITPHTTNFPFAIVHTPSLPPSATFESCSFLL